MTDDRQLEARLVEIERRLDALDGRADNASAVAKGFRIFADTKLHAPLRTLAGEVAEVRRIAEWPTARAEDSLPLEAPLGTILVHSAEGAAVVYIGSGPGLPLRAIVTAVRARA